MMQRQADGQLMDDEDDDQGEEQMMGDGEGEDEDDMIEIDEEQLHQLLMQH